MVINTEQTETEFETEAQSPYVLDRAQGVALFDRQARRLLGISGEEFLKRWDAGEYRDLAGSPEETRVVHLLILMPFGRPDS